MSSCYNLSAADNSKPNLNLLVVSLNTYYNTCTAAATVLLLFNVILFDTTISWNLCYGIGWLPYSDFFFLYALHASLILNNPLQVKQNWAQSRSHTSSLSVRTCFWAELLLPTVMPVGLPGTSTGVLGSSSGMRPMPGLMWPMYGFNAILWLVANEGDIGNVV